MRVAVVVGHSSTSKGAINASFVANEFDFNRKLAQNIKNKFDEYNLTDEIVVVYRKNGYAALPREINNLGVDLVVSLHCNAFNTQASGCEMLYYHRSKKGKEIARIFQNKLVQNLDNKDRGNKPKTSEDRGGPLLKYTKAPAIICEPFFIDNDEDYLRADECFHNGDLTRWYCEAINESLKYLKEV